MIHMQLTGHSERTTDDATFFPQTFGKHAALEAQQRTYEALAFGTAGIVLNTYATGSGKTKAALLYLHPLAKRGENCLVIAPTNELLMQHATDIAAFCQANQLDYQVLPLTAAYLDHYEEQLKPLYPQLKRRAANLESVLRDPRILEDADGQKARPQQPYVLVTNPDIFYQAVFRGYGRYEEREVMKQFVTNFAYIVIDEFHYYNPKQAANFLFFFNLWKEFGYFATGAKVCLLSATPSKDIWYYLTSLGVEIAEISPDNESEHANGQRVPSLAPVDLTVYTTDELGTDGFIELVRQKLPEIKERLAAGQQGAIISGALWRIDLIHDVLRSSGIAAERIGRITGPQKREDRAIATTRDLILATPTVDLGYNFDRPGKTRQSIDFLLFDAAFADEFVQRLGRAARVLGKTETDIPSTVFALVPPTLANVLRPLAERSISRAELRHVLNEALDTKILHERQAIFDYITTGAIFEAFLPILRLHNMGGEAILNDLHNLFDQICNVFRTPSYMRFQQLEKITRRYTRDDALFRMAPTERNALHAHLLSLKEDQAIKAWLQDTFDGKSPDPRSANFLRLKQEVQQGGKARDLFRNWAVQTQQRYAVRAASFQFRDSFQAPQALIYDHYHCLSDATVKNFDALHIIQNCDAEYLDAAEWHRRFGEKIGLIDEDAAVFFAVIHSLLMPAERRKLSFHITLKEEPNERKPWEDLHVCQMTALRDVKLATDRGQLPEAAIQMFANRYLPAFIVPRAHWIGGKLQNLAADYGLRCYPLEVLFATDSIQHYSMMLGTAALLAAARMQRDALVFHKQQAQADHDMIWS